ncbi:serine protease Do [Paenibacillus sophorae]|uniref:Serine protease Do n=1 Tax=Paenibacillus sophorae TaxID=1333845 RepID=A0A1H8I133_9BACL|nr:trypsin-like peptidase domain-containing protein [Paenibacillus sophorae]QWU15822.1 trypsin-like peptidase domain-containing protein [Paenibacillus sophorae]SEN62243.1 serine protease Do [Paenibacillus sophorae]
MGRSGIVRISNKSLRLLLCSAVLGLVLGWTVPVSEAARKSEAAAAHPSSTGEGVSAVDPVPQIYKRLSPSVVGIIGKAQGEKNTGLDNRYNLMHGSGVIITSRGWIVTNAHVIGGMRNATVVTADGKSYSVKEMYADEVSDVALLKINAASLQPASFAEDSNVRVGEKVIAIGAPLSFALRNSATVGVVSGSGRVVDASYRLLQSDAAINPGNSGGPLVDMNGKVIGIVSMKYSAVGVENTGFAIPAETARYIIKQLFTYGEVRRPSLGLELQESWSAIIGLPAEDPLTVTKVTSEEARKAGISEGDELYSIDGHRVTSAVDINELFKSYRPGQTAHLLMQSSGDIVQRKLVLGQGDPVVNTEEEDGGEDSGPAE